MNIHTANRLVEASKNGILSPEDIAKYMAEVKEEECHMIFYTYIFITLYYITNHLENTLLNI
jgi:hypothetical protein